MIKRIGSVCLLFVLSTHILLSQSPRRYTASEIQLAIKKLNVLGSALYVAAHPDDENQRLITYFSNELLMESGYMALTRGDGGQNLVGSEIREQLGVIRTQELLQARKKDGGKQYFSRANDFGYSKNPDETFTIWDREEVLADLVWVIRKTRPDVIISRFPTDGRGRHGHHTASAILAEEAYEAASDKTKFPEQLDYLDTWQVKRVFWNTHPFFFRGDEKFENAGAVQVDVGGYNTLLGKSYTEIAAESRSMHKSQGFGATGSRGESIEYLIQTKGEKSKNILDDIDLSWSRVKGGKKVQAILQSVYKNFKSENPSASVSGLLEAYKALDKVKDVFWRDLKKEQIKTVIEASLGLFLEATSNDYSATPGDSLYLNIEAINRSNVEVRINSIKLPWPAEVEVDTLKNNRGFMTELRTVLPKTKPYSQPYWLKEKGTLGMYSVSDQRLISTPENDPSVELTFNLKIAGTDLSYSKPLVFKRNDRVNGETYRPFVITPPVFVNLSESVHIFANGSKNVQVTIKAGKANTVGEVRLELPNGWISEPKTFPFGLAKKDQEEIFEFRISAPDKDNVGQLKAVALVDGNEYSQGILDLTYDHIPTQVLLPDATARIVKLNIEKRGKYIGYIMGAGDDIPTSLEQIGYEVDILDEAALSNGSFDKYDAIICGVRAFNTVERLKFANKKLMDYVNDGGNLIVQYNTNGGLVTSDIGPYPIKLSRDRVAVEEAPITMLLPDHEILNSPNKITSKDFDGWVQERGLYFPNEWDEKYEAILSSNDPGEDPKNGGMLVAKYGKGYYIYSGYSWFRELPAGVPGAYRIFANMISIGKK